MSEMITVTLLESGKDRYGRIYSPEAVRNIAEQAKTRNKVWVKTERAGHYDRKLSDLVAVVRSTFTENTESDGLVAKAVIEFVDHERMLKLRDELNKVGIELESNFRFSFRGKLRNDNGTEIVESVDNLYAISCGDTVP